MDEMTRLKAEAAAFRGLVQHLQKRSDVANIDLMNLAGFCRNCLAKWYKTAAEHYGAPMTYEQAQEVVYGMPIGEWKEKFQKPANAEQEKKFEDSKPLHAKITVVE
jgi:hypothetical protein